MTAKIVFFDCDGTLTTVKSSWEYLHRRLGLWDDNADEYQKLFRSGAIGYHEFCRRDALLWRGLPAERIGSVISEIPYQDGARELLCGLRAAGVITVVVSTGLSMLVEKVRRELSIDLSFSNDLLEERGHLSGEILINVDYNMKGPIVRHALERFSVSFENAAAVGDGEGDRGMFEEVGLPIGFNMNGNRGPFPGRTVYVEHLSAIPHILGVSV